MAARARQLLLFADHTCGQTLLVGPGRPPPEPRTLIPHLGRVRQLLWLSAFCVCVGVSPEAGRGFSGAPDLRASCFCTGHVMQNVSGKLTGQNLEQASPCSVSGSLAMTLVGSLAHATAPGGGGEPAALGLLWPRPLPLLCLPARSQHSRSALASAIGTC